MARSVISPQAVSGQDGSWTYIRIGGFCVLTFAYQATGVPIQNSESGQYQSNEINTGISLPSWVTGIIAVSGSAGAGSQTGGVRLHRVTLWDLSATVKFALARATSSASANFPFTVIVFGTC